VNLHVECPLSYKGLNISVTSIPVQSEWSNEHGKSPCLPFVVETPFSLSPPFLYARKQ
jgi:hypothetical protein